MVQGTYYIETYGCQMNEHDSEKMATLLEGIGLTVSDSPERADVIVINTCAIREKAEHKVYSALGKIKSIKEKNPAAVMVVSGCVAQQEKDRLLKRAGHLDIVLGTHRISDLPVLVEQVRETRRRVVMTDFSDYAPSLNVPAPCKGHSPVCSFVTIMQGCSNFCAYCVVPFTRGPEQNRLAERIVEEVQALTEKGVKEVTLLGQNVNAFRDPFDRTYGFASLLKELDGLLNGGRIRFTTSHPRDFDDDLIHAMADLESVCEHVHLPLQAGSDRVLKAMRRGYTRGDYMRKIEKLRRIVPSIAVTSDIIVGFPGESEKDFAETLSALEEIGFDQIFSFKYSPRPATAAQSFSGQVAEDVKSRRLAEVQTLQDQITETYHLEAEGTDQEILIEGVRSSSGQPFGRTRNHKIVNLDADSPVGIGDIVRVRIIRGLKHSLAGRMILE